jgi:hypothetical protein
VPGFVAQNNNVMSGRGIQREFSIVPPGGIISSGNPPATSQLANFHPSLCDFKMV